MRARAAGHEAIAGAGLHPVRKPFTGLLAHTLLHPLRPKGSRKQGLVVVAATPVNLMDQGQQGTEVRWISRNPETKPCSSTPWPAEMHAVLVPLQEG